MIKIALDEEDFKTLINGGVVKKAWGLNQVDDVEIILSDIGWDRMLFAIEESTLK